MQNLIHPAVLEATMGKSGATSNLFLIIASLLSLITELIGIGVMLSYDGLQFIGIITLFFVPYTIICLLYLFVFKEEKERLLLPCLRTAVIVYGVILYIAAAYPGIPFLFIFGIFGGFYQVVYWAVFFGIMVLYYHITAFMILVSRDHKKLITDQLILLDMQRAGYTLAPPPQQLQYQQQY